MHSVGRVNMVVELPAVREARVAFAARKCYSRVLLVVA